MQHHFSEGLAFSSPNIVPSEGAFPAGVAAGSNSLSGNSLTSNSLSNSSDHSLSGRGEAAPLVVVDGVGGERTGVAGAVAGVGNVAEHLFVPGQGLGFGGEVGLGGDVGLGSSHHALNLGHNYKELSSPRAFFYRRIFAEHREEPGRTGIPGGLFLPRGIRGSPERDREEPGRSWGGISYI